MGIVTDKLYSLIQRQLDERRLVIWFDPEQHYAAVAADLAMPGVAVHRYEGSFFALRHAIDTLLDGEDPPQLVVYVPLAEEETHDALIELTTVGAVIKPGQNPMLRNTRLSVVAKWALKDTLGAERLDDVVRLVEAGKISLADLDQMDANQGESAVVATIFKTGNPADVALLFLSNGAHDQEIVARQALDEVCQVLGRAVGIELTGADSCTVVRERLATHVLATEFLSSLSDPVPAALRAVPVASEPLARQTALELAHTWRQRRDLQESYATYAAQTEKALHLADLTLPMEQLLASETFEWSECELQAAVERALLAGAQPDLVDLARTRQGSFWSARQPEVQARWALIAVAGLLLLQASWIEQQIKAAPAAAGGFLQLYAEGDQPWCMLDTHHRNLERLWHTFDIGLGPRHQSLEQLVMRARQRYMEVGGALAERFVRTLAQSRFAAAGVERQRAIYARHVQPALKQGKTAYVLVDALRFEMGRELFQSFGESYAGELHLAVGTPPSITEIGMAALMPGADSDPVIVAAGEGKLGLRIGAAVLKDRKSRLEWFRSQHQGHVVIATLEDILPKPKKALEEELKRADLILITSQEIDVLAEGDNIRLARKVMDSVLPDLARLVNKLREVGCATIVMSADHGYLFGDELDTDMKIDPPGGQTLDLHRRVWVGRGGSADAAFLRTPLAAFGLSDDLDIAVPWGFGVFKTPGGARAYFHGGMSPQELAIPVLVLRPDQQSRAENSATVQWTLTSGSKKITTRFCSVQITAQALGLFDIEPVKVRIEVRAKDEIVSTAAIAATYGLIEATGEVELAASANDGKLIDPNTVTLQISPSFTKGSVSIHLLDTTTGRELARIEQLDLALLQY